MAFEISWLTKEEEETVKQALINFVVRVSSYPKNRSSEEELKILPQIVDLLLNNMSIS